MKTVLRWFTCVLVSGTIAFGASSEWRIADGPLKTKWAKDVSPRHPWPEYPRPQMVRKEWMNLNGLWDYVIADGKEQTVTKWNQQTGFGGTILVPYPIESALSGVMERVDENHRIIYHRTFELPQKWKDQRILLHFGAVDWETLVFVNGKKLGEHRGGYDPFTFDITDALKSSKEQELVVSVWDPTEEGQPRGKQSRRPQGIFYTPSSGIWQTVWLEPVPMSGIDEVKLTPDLDAQAIRVTVESRHDTRIDSDVSTEVVAYRGGKEVGRTKGKPGQELLLAISQPHLWTPEDPFLYDLKIRLLDSSGKTLDAVNSYFAMRKIALGKDEQGITRPMLNGKFVFQVGPLDQGFWPDGIYTPPTDEAMRYDLEITKKLGFNMTRKHVKVEPDRWYYYCDKMGLLVWQDMPSGNNKTVEDKAEFERELNALVRTHYNHPSIVMWVVFNEGWGQFDTERLTAHVKQMDPSRLVDNATGWTDMKCGDVIDMHNYPGPGSPQPEPNRAAVLGEFGGLGLGIDGHTWTQKTWGYQGMSDRNALTRRYVNLLRKAWSLKESPGLSAIVYTQITDVETECNGLMTYDRAVIKPDVKKINAANNGHVPPEPKHTIVVPTSKEAPMTWKYTFEKPSDNWMKPKFDDSSWRQGPGGFGTAGTPGAVVRTTWNTGDIWLRRTFELPPGKYDEVSLLVHHDEDAEIFINGQLATKLSNYGVDYTSEGIRSRALNSLKPGLNTLAVHCRNTAGGQYIDVGLEKIGD